MKIRNYLFWGKVRKLVLPCFLDPQGGTVLYDGPSLISRLFRFGFSNLLDGWRQKSQNEGIYWVCNYSVSPVCFWQLGKNNRLQDCCIAFAWNSKVSFFLTISFNGFLEDIMLFKSKFYLMTENRRISFRPIFDRATKIVVEL